MAIFVTGLTGGAAEENDITMKFVSGSTANVFANNTSFYINATWDIRINENITDISNMFSSQNRLEGTILLNCYPTNYSDCFYFTGDGYSDIPVNYTSLCTNIDAIIATGNTGSITKGSLVVV